MKNQLKYLFIFGSIFLFAAVLFAQRQAASNLDCPYCDLSGKDYSGQDLTNANLIGAQLTGANFSGATLNGAQFLLADLSGANFGKSKIGSSSKGPANFSAANLTKASFNGASIGNVSFQYTDLSCTDFSNTDLTKALFGVQLKFNSSTSCKPKFSNCKIDCEFPWYWDQFDMTGTNLPNCRNSKIKSSDNNGDSEYEKSNIQSASRTVSISATFPRKYRQ